MCNDNWQSVIIIFVLHGKCGYETFVTERERKKYIYGIVTIITAYRANAMIEPGLRMKISVIYLYTPTMVVIQQIFANLLPVLQFVYNLSSW